jgi:tetratricopeptide (TPR) repeat protein
MAVIPGIERLMNKVTSRLIFVFLLFTLNSCAFVGVPTTSDPAKKLAYADDLIGYQRRPLPAEQLIREVLDIYTRENNEVGIAETYKTYGYFFQSKAVEEAKGWYIKNGFQDKSASYETRFQKSIEYYKKAEAIFVRFKDYSKLTNVYLNIGYAYYGLGDHDNTCKSFRKSLDSNREYLAANPGTRVFVPEGYKTYEEYMAKHFDLWKCK